MLAETEYLETRELKDEEFVLQAHPAVLAAITPNPPIEFVHGKDHEFICPFCGNGTGDSKTGIEVKGLPRSADDSPKYYCHVCHRPFNNLDIFAQYYGVDLRGKNFYDVAKKARALIESVPDDAIPKHSESYVPAKNVKDYRAFQRYAVDNLEEFLNEHGGTYRGLTLETFRRYGVGYAPKFGTPQTPRLIIPSSATHFLARFVGSLDDYSDADKRLIHEKQHCGAKSLFGMYQLYRTLQDLITARKLKRADCNVSTFPPVFIVEGEIDAMAGYQLTGYEFLALSGLTLKDEMIKELPDIPLTFVVMLDNDNAGRDAEKDVAEKLTAAGHMAITARLGSYDSNGNYFPLTDDKGNVVKDLNDALQKFPDVTKFILRGICDNAKKLSDKKSQDNQDGSLQNRGYTPPFDNERVDHNKVDTADKKNDDVKVDSTNQVSTTDKLKWLWTLDETQERNFAIVEEIRKRCTKNRQKRIEQTPYNLELIFRYDPNLRGLIGYDTFIEADVHLRRPMWNNGFFKKYQDWKDTDDSQLRNYLRKTYMNMACSDILRDFLVSESQSHYFNRVQDYFKHLPKWDGIPRAETYFIKFLKVDDTPFAREVSLNWLTAAIARIFNPGCRYQTTLILHGNQGSGKSYVLERLGGAWHIALTDSVDDSHAEDALRRGWIIELKELSSLRKAELNHIKSFLELSQATRRFAYDRRASTVDRHCVFAGTVNDNEFLRDVTGNRRFMILHSNLETNKPVKGITDELIQQIWAETYEHYCNLFKDGFNEEKLQLSDESKMQGETVAEGYLADDGLKSEISAFLDKKLPPNFIWQLMNKTERHKFFVEGKITYTAAELNMRVRSSIRNKKAIDDTINKIYVFLNTKADNSTGECFVHEEQIKISNHDSKTVYHIYGNTYRQHICAAEVFNEFFGGGDKRKQMFRISEILPTLSDWDLGARLQGKDTCYYDQKKVFYRVKTNAFYVEDLDV